MIKSNEKSKWIISNGGEPVDSETEFIGTGGTVHLFSKNLTHGGFAQDIDTMNSVIKSIVGYEDIVPFTADGKFFKEVPALLDI